MCKCKYKFGGTKCNSNQWQNRDKYRCQCKTLDMFEKGYVWNLAACSCENGKYLATIMDKIIYDEIIYVKEMNLNKKIELVKHKVSIF